MSTSQLLLIYSLIPTFAMYVQVLPGLYVGNYQDSKDADQLERFEITHILAIHDTARRLHSVSYRLKINDERFGIY